MKKCGVIWDAALSAHTACSALMEIFDGNKDHALNQIKDKKYFEKYQGAGKEIYLLGVEFADRNVG